MVPRRVGDRPSHDSRAQREDGRCVVRDRGICIADVVGRRLLQGYGSAISAGLLGHDRRQSTRVGLDLRYREEPVPAPHVTLEPQCIGHDGGRENVPLRVIGRVRTRLHAPPMMVVVGDIPRNSPYLCRQIPVVQDEGIVVVSLNHKAIDLEGSTKVKDDVARSTVGAVPPDGTAIPLNAPGQEDAIHDRVRAGPPAAPTALEEGRPVQRDGRPKRGVHIDVRNDWGRGVFDSHRLCSRRGVAAVVDSRPLDHGVAQREDIRRVMGDRWVGIAVVRRRGRGKEGHEVRVGDGGTVQLGLLDREGHVRHRQSRRGRILDRDDLAGPGHIPTVISPSPRTSQRVRVSAWAIRADLLEHDLNIRIAVVHGGHDGRSRHTVALDHAVIWHAEQGRHCPVFDGGRLLRSVIRYVGILLVARYAGHIRDGRTC